MAGTYCHACHTGHGLHGDAGRTRQTEIGFGGLTRQQQITGIGYLFVEDSLAAE